MWDAAEFESALRGLAQRYWDRHPFHLRLHDGSLPESGLRLWAANRWYYQCCLPQKDAAIVANCPLPAVRRQWLARVVEHDGREDNGGGTARWLRLAEAVGLRREEVLDERHVLPGVRFAVDGYVHFARTHTWLEGVASGLTELFSPELMRRRMTALLHHYPWISSEALEYFTARLDSTDHGRSTMDLVVEHCHTRAEQHAAVAALSFKCDVLWAMLDALDHAAARA